MEHDKNERTPLRDHTGRELSESEVKKFVSKSQEFGFERHLIISPDPQAGYTEREIDRNTRKVMSNWRAGKPSADYVYSVHPENDNPHAHVAVTGEKEDLRMEKEDLRQFREQAREAFREKARVKEHQRQQTPERDREPDRSRSHQRQRNRSYSGPGHSPGENDAKRDEGERSWSGRE